MYNVQARGAAIHQHSHFYAEMFIFSQKSRGNFQQLLHFEDFVFTLDRNSPAAMYARGVHKVCLQFQKFITRANEETYR